MSEPESPRRSLLLIALIAVVVAWTWIRPLDRSLWLDEAGTYWIVKDDAATAAARPWRHQAQTPLYYLVAYGARRALGDHEWALRLPSVLGMAVACALVGRWARRVRDLETGLVAALVLACVAARWACEARPYAIAMALAVASMMVFDRWCANPRWILAIPYAISVALVIAVHYLYGTLILAQIAFALWDRRIPLPRFAVGLALGGLAVLPCVQQLRQIWGTRELSFLGTPGVTELYSAFLPPAVFLGIAAALVAAVVLSRWLGEPKWTGLPDRRAVVLFALWAYVPVASTFAVSTLTSAKCFFNRYYSCAFPGVALLVAVLLRSVEPRPLRAIAACLIVAATIAKTDSAAADWRGLMTAERAAATDATPVLYVSGFTQSQLRSEVEDRDSILRAPLALYPARGKVLIVSRLLRVEDEPRLEELARDELEPSGRFLAVGEAGPLDGYVLWLRGRFVPRGWIVERTDLRGVAMLTFSRPR